MTESKEKGSISIGNYLLARLVQLGAITIQGVPGDYNMGFLDSIEDHETLKWVGNCNELNAAYSADGYARTPRRNPQNKTIPGRGKVAALVTTFGVGDLSCLNGIAGSFAERVPVVHIVGVPSTSLQGKGALLHHTLGNGSFDVFKEMSKHIVIASAILGEFVDDPVYACKMIDRTLTKGFREARPVYITLPMDMVDLAAPTSNMLGTPLDISPLENDKEAEADCIREILSRIDAAKDPIIILDACAIRHDVLAESHELVEKSGFSVFSTPMGKSAMDEGHSQFGGIYVGSNTVPEIKERVESADLLIQIGSLLSDFNTANFSYRTPRSATIDFHSDRISVGYATYNNIGMKAVLPKISAHLSSRHKQRLDLTLSTLPKFENILPTREEEIKNGASKEGKDAEDHITQAWLWPRIGMFIEKDDQIIAETGTSSFGSLAIKLPSSSFPNFHSQVLWGSIGWSVGACLGVALAAREEKLGRVILFVGDGSFQLTAQEVSTMVREGLNPIIFVLSNDGYEIERQIHGPERRYNNTARWNFKSFCDTFNDVNKVDDVTVGGLNKDSNGDFKKSHVDDVPQSKIEYFAIKTKEDMDKLLSDQSFAHSKALRFVEVFVSRGDAPKALLGQANS